jgi:hypothetical protein
VCASQAAKKEGKQRSRARAQKADALAKSNERIVARVAQATTARMAAEAAANTNNDEAAAAAAAAQVTAAREALAAKLGDEMAAKMTHVSAAKMQAAVRGKQARRAADDRAHGASATRVQAAVRGRIARKQAALSHESATKVQAAVRGRLTRRRLVEPEPAVPAAAATASVAPAIAAPPAAGPARNKRGGGGQRRNERGGLSRGDSGGGGSGGAAEGGADAPRHSADASLRSSISLPALAPSNGGRSASSSVLGSGLSRGERRRAALRRQGGISGSEHSARGATERVFVGRSSSSSHSHPLHADDSWLSTLRVETHPPSTYELSLAAADGVCSSSPDGAPRTAPAIGRTLLTTSTYTSTLGSTSQPRSLPGVSRSSLSYARSEAVLGAGPIVVSTHHPNCTRRTASTSAMARRRIVALNALSMQIAHTLETAADERTLAHSPRNVLPAGGGDGNRNPSRAPLQCGPLPAAVNDSWTCRACDHMHA